MSLSREIYIKLCSSQSCSLESSGENQETLANSLKRFVSSKLGNTFDQIWNNRLYEPTEQNQKPNKKTKCKNQIITYRDFTMYTLFMANAAIYYDCMQK